MAEPNTVWNVSIKTKLRLINEKTDKNVQVDYMTLGYASYYELSVDGEQIFSGTQESDPDCESLHWFVSGMWEAITLHYK